MKQTKLLVGLLFGLSTGYILTRSRYGFAGGIKRIYIRGEGSLSKGLLISLAVLTVLYGTLQWAGYSKGYIPAYLVKAGQTLIPGTQNVHFINLSLIIGGFLFGIGMIIAGGCASGTLSDFGEGEVHAIIAFPLFVIGSLPGEWLRVVIHQTNFGKNYSTRVYLVDYFGYFGAMLVTLLGLLFIYYLVIRYEKIRKKEKTYLDPMSDYLDFEKPLTDTLETPYTFTAIYHSLFVKRWSFKTGGYLLAIASAAYMTFTTKAWGVTTAFAKLDAYIFKKFGLVITNPGLDKIYHAVDKGLLNDVGVILDIGIVIGALLAFLLAGRFKPLSKFDAKNGFLFGLGGFLMGFGARLAHGCNIGALYSSIPNLSLAGWFFLVAISLGAVVALKLFEGGRSCLIPPRHRDPKDFK